MILEAFKENRALRGVDHATAGARDAVAPLPSLGRDKDVVFITHELTEDRRALLKERAIDAIIDQNPEIEARTATELMARFLGRMEGPTATTVTPIQIYTSENV